MTSWDLAGSKVTLSFDAEPEAKTEVATVSAKSVRFNEDMGLIPVAEEDRRRIERQKLVRQLISSSLSEVALVNMTMTLTTASHKCTLISHIPSSGLH